MPRSLLASLALAASLVAVPVQAQQQLVSTFNETVLRSAVQSLGGTIGQATVENGVPFYQITLTNGVPAVANLDQCEGQSCRSLIIVASMPLPQGRTIAELDELLRRVNNSVPPAKVFRVDQTVLVQTYIIADAGITQGNLQAQMNVFADVALSMYQTLNAPE